MLLILDTVGQFSIQALNKRDDNSSAKMRLSKQPILCHIDKNNESQTIVFTSLRRYVDRRRKNRLKDVDALFS